MTRFLLSVAVVAIPFGSLGADLAQRRQSATPATKGVLQRAVVIDVKMKTKSKIGPCTAFAIRRRERI